MTYFVSLNLSSRTHTTPQFTQLQDRLTEARAEADDLRRAQTAKDNDLNTKDALLLKASSDIEHLQKEIMGKERELYNITLDLANSKDELLTTISELQNSAADNEEIQNEITNQNGTIEMLTKDVESKEEKISTLTSDVETREKIVKALRHDITSKDEELGTTVDAIRKQETVLANIEELLRQKEAEISILKSDRDKNVFELSDELSYTKLQLESAKKRNDTYNDEINELNKTLKDYARQLEEISLQCNTVNSQLEVKKNEVVEVTEVAAGKRARLEGEVVSLMKRVRELELVKVQGEEMERQGRSEIMVLTNDIEIMRKEYREINEVRNEEMVRLKELLHVSEEDQRIMQKGMEVMSASNEETSKELADLQERYASDKGTLNLEIDNMESELAEYKTRLDVNLKELSAVIDRESEARNTLISAQARHHEIEGHMADQVEELQRLFYEKEEQIENMTENMTRQIDHLLNQKHEVMGRVEGLEGEKERGDAEVEEMREEVAKLTKMLLEVCGDC